MPPQSVQPIDDDPVLSPRAAGVYFYRLVMGKQAISRKMVLLR